MLSALSFLMLPVGGGIVPVLAGIIAGTVGTRINAPLAWWRRRLSGSPRRMLAVLWPGTLVAFLVWVPIQWLFGHYFNDFLLDQVYLFMLAEYALLLLSIAAGFAHDIKKTTASGQANPAGIL